MNRRGLSASRIGWRQLSERASDIDAYLTRIHQTEPIGRSAPPS